LLEKSLLELLEAYKSGRLSSAEAVERLKRMPFEDLGFAKVDHHRALRQGFPEVIYSPGKTPEQLVAILKSLVKNDTVALASRLSPEQLPMVQAAFPSAEYRPDARLLVVFPEGRTWPDTSKRSTYIAVCTGGTSDIPVAEEAALVAELMGHKVERLYDVGVAGLHRLISQHDLLLGANVVVAVAGMEGALASVIGGLVSAPVVAVPTSVGYGANFNGLSALLAMLNSCATGVAVVNIDNGFGAGFFAALIDK